MTKRPFAVGKQASECEHTLTNDTLGLVGISIVTNNLEGKHKG